MSRSGFSIRACASATDSIGSSTPQSVTATPAIPTLPTITFSATAGAPPTSAAATLTNIECSDTAARGLRYHGQRHAHRHVHDGRDLWVSLHAPRWDERDSYGRALSVAERGAGSGTFGRNGGTALLFVPRRFR